jgi:ribosomal protein S18 acetylase RimI-like enzyme
MLQPYRMQPVTKLLKPVKWQDTESLMGIKRVFKPVKRQDTEFLMGVKRVFKSSGFPTNHHMFMRKLMTYTQRHMGLDMLLQPTEVIFPWAHVPVSLMSSWMSLSVHGELIGAMQFQMVKNCIGEHAMFIFQCHIKLEHRGKGLARLLLERAIEPCRPLPGGVHLDSREESIGFWKHMGFKRGTVSEMAHVGHHHPQNPTASYMNCSDVDVLT